jgi:hypothetical protein
MALDRPDDEADALAEARPEQNVRRGENGGEVSGESAELRSHEEYYEALRAADDGESSDASDSGEESARGEPADIDESADDSGDLGEADERPTGNGGWEAVDAEKRPPLEAISVSPERATHILDGDPGNSGGHRHGVGRPRKTEFPAAWDDDKILGHVLDVARRPDSAPVLQDRNNRWICTGTRENVEISVILLRSGEVWTAWPEEGSPGVVRNPKKETS